MKREKKGLCGIMSFLLIVVFMLGGYTPAVKAETQAFTINSAGTITAYNGSETEVVIPRKINGITVTKIGEKAFYRKNLTSVTIPYGVIEIGISAFAMNAFTEVTIPGSVSVIKAKAFMACTSLQKVTLMYGIETIEDGAFSSCNSLTTITMADSIQSIAGNMLGNRRNATVEIEANEGSVASNYVPSGALAPAVEDKQMDANNICNYEYEVDGEGNISIINYYGQGEQIDLVLPEADAFGGTAITEIGVDAFQGHHNLHTADFSRTSIKTIGCNAFSGCIGLVHIILPETVTSIGDNAFECEDTELTIESDSETVMNYILGDGTNIEFEPYSPGRTYYHELTVSATYGGTVRIGKSGIYKAGVKIAIAAVAMNGYNFVGWEYSNGSLELPEDVTDTSRASAYYMPNCDAQLRAVFEKQKRPDWVIKNGVVVEFNLHGEMNIPSEYGQNGEGTSPIVPTTAIAGNAFYYGGTPTKVIIPASITTIASNAFNDYFCYGLNEFEVASGNQNFCSVDGVLFSKDMKVLIRYPQAKSADTYTIPSSVTQISAYAFYNCTKLKSVSIPSGVTNISSYAFYNCTKLNSINIPSGVTKLPSYVFLGCRSLSSVAVNGNLTEIGDGAFEACTSLHEFVIQNTVTSIGEWAFFGCGIQSVTIPASVTRIGTYAFSSCRSLENITVVPSNSVYKSIDGVLYNKAATVLISYPCFKKNTAFTILDSVTSIGDGAFYSCGYLQTITYGTGLKSVGDSAFQNCVSLETIQYPENCVLEHIGSYAFEYCYGLTNVVIPSSVTYIGENAYLYCRWLEAFEVSEENLNYRSDENGALLNKQATILIKYPSASQAQTYEVAATVERVQQYAFEYSVNLKAVRLPESVDYIGQLAFYMCSGLKALEVRNPSVSFSSYYVLNGTPASLVLRGFSYQETEDTQEPAMSTVQTYANYYKYRFQQLDPVSTGIKVNQDGKVIDYLGTATEVELPNAVVIPEGEETVTTTGAVDEFEYQNLADMAADMDRLQVIQTIGSQAFLEDGTETASITKIEYNSQLSKIEAYAFDGCEGITEVEIPASITVIDPIAFTNCSNFTTFIVDSGNKNYSTVDNGILCNKDKTIIKLVPTAYAGSNGEMTIGGKQSTIQAIADGAFSTNTGLNRVTIKDISYIGSGAFKDAFTNEDHLIEIILVGIDDIEDTAFADCTGIRRVNLLNSSYVDDAGTLTEVMLTRLGSNAFEGCTNLEEFYIDIDNTVYESIEGVVYTKKDENNERRLIAYPPNKNAGENYAIESDTIEIATDAFKHAKIATVTIPDSVLSIGSHAFEDCMNLHTISIPENLVTIGDYAFNGCTGLEIVDIPESVTQLGQGVFSGCSGLMQLIVRNGNLNLSSAVIQSDIPTFTIYSVSGSAVETYADNEQILFAALVQN